MNIDVFLAGGSTFWDYRSEHDFEGLVQHVTSLFGDSLNEGRHRAVFALSERFVVKVPLCAEGLSDNWDEAARCRQEGYPKARCRLYRNCLLVMERVDEYLDPEEIPDWAAYIDCGQVGRARDGQIKAFDFALG